MSFNKIYTNFFEQTTTTTTNNVNQPFKGKKNIKKCRIMRPINHIRSDFCANLPKSRSISIGSNLDEFKNKQRAKFDNFPSLWAKIIF